MTKKPHILITNDDGIQAPGIKHLCSALQDFAKVSIVAPKTEQSGVGLGITIRSALHIEEFPWEGVKKCWSVSGTPADCVKMAASVLLPSPPDLIVSGINRGTNAGRTVLYSGTIGGVIEGILRGIPGIAFSSFDIIDTEYALFAPFIPHIVQYILDNPLPAGSLLNVNFPSKDPAFRIDKSMDIKGLKLTRQGKQYWLEEPLLHHQTSASYTLGARLAAFEEAEDSDIYWLERGYISCVPVHVDELTDWRYIKSKAHHFEELLTRVSLGA